MKRILIADTDAAARKMLARVLESCGHAPVEASSESEAISKFGAAPPALVILDLKGALWDGWKVYEAIHRLDSLVPVIGITAWSNQHAEAMRRGVDALMEKPLDLNRLLELIEQLASDSEQDGKCSLNGRDSKISADPQPARRSGVSA